MRVRLNIDQTGSISLSWEQSCLRKCHANLLVQVLKIIQVLKILKVLKVV